MRSAFFSLFAVALAACSAHDRTTTEPPQPTPIGFAIVSAGRDHTCALARDGSAYCWGSGIAGQLGDSARQAVLTPTAVAGGLHFAAIAAGTTSSCAVTAASLLYCWGAADVGQLATFDTVSSTFPRPAFKAEDRLVHAVTAGNRHACGLRADGMALCWGWNFYGQLGIGARFNLLTAEPTAGSLRFSSLSAGGNHTCAVTNHGGAYCWGDNARGQLGDGSLIQRDTPVAVAGGLVLAAVATGELHSCGLTAAGSAYCWGAGDAGQLGNGAEVDSPVPVRVGGSLSFAAITVGGQHSCGLTAAGAAYCWGQNSQGQLGSGGPPFIQSTPVIVAGSHHFVAITAGGLHTCAIDDAAAIYCWGYGGFGQLGTGSILSPGIPSAVQAPTVPTAPAPTAGASTAAGAQVVRRE